MFKYRDRVLVHELVLFNKFLFYYVKKSKANLWYKNKIPFFRIGFIVLYDNAK